MKKTAALVLAFVLLLCVLASCGQSAGGGNGSGNGGSSGTSGSESSTETTGGAGEDAGAFDPAQMKTLGDVYQFVRFDDEDSNIQEAYSETQYIIAFDVDGVYYRAKADLPEDVSKSLWNIDFEDPDKESKMIELLSPLELSSFDNITENMPTQEEADKYVGKTGQELFDEGWNYWFYNLEDMSAGFFYGDYAYTVTFEYDGPQMENTDDFDFYEEFKDLKVKSVTCDGIGDAANTDN